MAQGSTAFNRGFDAYRGWSYSDDDQRPMNPYFNCDAEREMFIDWNMGWDAAEAAEAAYMEHLVAQEDFEHEMEE